MMTGLYYFGGNATTKVRKREKKTRQSHLCRTTDDGDDVFVVAVFETSGDEKKPLFVKCQKQVIVFLFKSWAKCSSWLTE